MRSCHFVLAGAALLMSSCGPSAEQIAEQQRQEAAAELARQEQAEQEARAKAERDCVFAAVGQMAAVGDTITLLNNVNAANLSNCPSDFSEAFTDYRGKFSFAVDKAREADAHRAAEGDAAGAGFVLTILEGITGESTGATPYSDWNGRDAELEDEVRSAFDALVQAKNQVLSVAARHGVTLNAADSSSSETENAM